MGTRNLTCVKLDGKYPIAQYGQFDGYPSGQGVTVYRFVKGLTRKKYRIFLRKLRAAQEMSEGECGKIWQDTHATFTGYPELMCGTAADILELVRKSPAGIKLVNHLMFASDSLFCEWTYVIDLDKRPQTLEVYVGFNKRPVPAGERFANMPRCEVHRNYEYYPIVHLHTFPLWKLPTTEEEYARILENKQETYHARS